MNRGLKNILVGLVVVAAITAVVACGIFLSVRLDKMAEQQRAEQLAAEKTYLGSVGGYRIDEFAHPKTGERFLVVTGYHGVSVVQIK